MEMVTSVLASETVRVFACPSPSVLSQSALSSHRISGLALKRSPVLIGSSSSAAGPYAASWSLFQRRSRNLFSAADGTAAAAALEVAVEESEAVPSEVPIEKRFPEFPTILDINAIRNILPHRFPFLLVDRVIEYNPGVSAVAIKNVTINENFFPGHFPERPIMPGVLMVEALAQVGGVVMLVPEVGGSKENFFFAGVDKVRFRKPVVAGDTLVMRMTLTKLQKRFGIAKMDGKAYVGGQVVCEGEFLFSIGSS